jgi:hypothetical protein
VNSERLINILKEQLEVANTSEEEPGTADTICTADIEFDSVAIGSLNPLSFRCKLETTTIVLGIPNGERASSIATPCLCFKSPGWYY